MATGTKDILTTEDAAQRLGITEPLVRRYCQQGRLGQKVGDRWMIDPSELKEFSKKKRHRGRPKAKKVR